MNTETLPSFQTIEEKFFNILRNFNYKIYTRPNTTVHVFPQTWGSTALGFEGIGCSAMTTAYTTVIQVDNTELYGVFFGEEFAYLVDNPLPVFFEDLKNRNMAPVYESNKYKSSVKEND